MKVRGAQLEKYLGYIGANVHRLRIAQGLTQEQLAARVGVELSFFQRVERAKTNMSVASLVSLATGLEVSVQTLLEPAKMPPPTRGRPKTSAGAGRRRG